MADFVCVVNTVKSNLLDKDTIAAVLSSLKGLTDQKLGQVLRVIDAFQLPRINYDPIRKILYP